MLSLLQAREKAKSLQLSNCNFQLVDAEAADFQAESFDAVLCSSGMLYMQDIASAIRRFQAWLRPGGRLCFNTPQARMHSYEQIGCSPPHDPTFRQDCLLQNRPAEKARTPFFLDRLVDKP